MSSTAVTYDGLLRRCDKVGWEMIKNGQIVKNPGKESGFYTGDTASPGRIFFKINFIKA